MKRMAAAIVVAVLAAGSVPATAQSAASEMTAEEFLLPLGLSSPADTGKPRFFVLPPVMPPPSGCAASFDCRVRVIGAIQYNGAVELNATMLKW
jgi:hypothetical protein